MKTMPMQKEYSVFAVLLLISLSFAGCSTQAVTDMNSPAATAAPTPDLGTIALRAADAPEGFVVMESRKKDAAEVSDMAVSLGWQGGYVVRFRNFEGSDGEPTVISQNIALYPEERMQDIVRYVEDTEKSGLSYIFMNLTDPGTGDFCTAYVAYHAAQKNETDIPNETAMTVNATPDIAYYEILFTKGPVFEVFRVSGPSANYTALSDLAGKAFRKL